MPRPRAAHRAPPIPAPAAPTTTPPERPVERPGPACPHCSCALVRHAGPGPRAGCWHCDGCGACWLPTLDKMRPGHPAPAGWSDPDN
jgi:hypothetical protein